MVEMSRRYYGSISSAAVIFTRRASANVKQWPGPRRQAANQAATDLLSAVIDERRAGQGGERGGWSGEVGWWAAPSAEFFISFTSARRLQIKQLFSAADFAPRCHQRGRRR